MCQNFRNTKPHQNASGKKLDSTFSHNTHVGVTYTCSEALKLRGQLTLLSGAGARATQEQKSLQTLECYSYEIALRNFVLYISCHILQNI